MPSILSYKVSAVDVSSDLSYDVTEDQHRKTNDAETTSGVKAFTFEEFPSSPSARLRSEGSADTDEEVCFLLVLLISQSAQLSKYPTIFFSTYSF